jgi:membrane protein implicated in regulation of membrane protease activity
VHPSWALFTVLLTTLARTREVRRPIVMMIAIAMPMLFAWIRYSGSDPSSMLGSVTMVVPLAMSLGWGVNVFGVLGGAVTLLLAQPRTWKPLLRHIILIQLIASILPGLLLMGVAVAISGMRWSMLPPYAAGLVASSVIATALSVRYSVEKPHRTRLTGRGDPLVPPIVGMGYVLRIMLSAATTGLVVAVAASLAPWLAAVICAIVALTTYGSWRRISSRWSDPAHRSSVAALVGAV